MAFTMTVAEVIAADTFGLLSKHDSWERVPLADIAIILNGAPFDSSLFSTSDGMPLVRIRDVLSGETTTYYTGSYDDLYVVKPYDLLIGMDGDFNCGFWGNQRALLNQRVCKITPDESYYDKRLLAYALPGYLSAINANTPSVTVKHLSSKTIGEIDLPLPPRSEQTRIVEKLEELFSDLDAGVAELKAAQKKLAQYRQSLLKAAVEGALTAEWRTKNKPKETGAQLLDRILKERHASWQEKQLTKFKEQGKTPPKDWQDKYPEPVEPDTSNLPELPEGWVWASVDALISNIETGKSFKCDERPPTIDEIGVVKVSAVSWGEYNEQESKTCTDSDRVNESLFVRPGDFLFSRANTIELVGACVIAEKVTLNVMLSDKILRFVLVDEDTKKWLLFLLRSELGRTQIEELASGNQESMRNIGQERIRQIYIPLPPSIEILHILSILDSNIEAAFAQSNAINVGLKQSAAQRKNILKDAFSGQLIQQNPNDEAASVLLERIREERKKQSLQPKQRKAKVIKEISIVSRKLIDVLTEAGDWLSAQEAFRRCGIADSATTEQIEELYSELRKLDKGNIIDAEPVTDTNGIKQYDRLRLAVKG